MKKKLLCWETTNEALKNAFESEKEINENWNKFLFDTSLLNLGNTNIINQNFNEEAFGSWFIETKNKRLVYDGKDCSLTIQSKVKNIWSDIDTLKKSDITYFNLMNLII